MPSYGSTVPLHSGIEDDSRGFIVIGTDKRNLIEMVILRNNRSSAFFAHAIVDLGLSFVAACCP